MLVTYRKQNFVRSASTNSDHEVTGKYNKNNLLIVKYNNNNFKREKEGDIQH